MCAVAAVLLAGAGYAEVEDMYWLQRRGEVVTATVVDEYSSGRSGERIDVRFVTRDGRTVETDTSNYLDAEAGTTIQVIYDPVEPTRLQAADYGFDYWLPGVFFGSGSLLMLTIAVFRFRD
ncbi:DUF3592 domain-containing protein [Kribbella sp. NPDC023972]|uniref:DUF3592 domain-containing protein n=1 Tax=Kribbella sp. NPDC023972 TaxID=3154795 RepID=UPI0033F16FC7